MSKDYSYNAEFALQTADSFLRLGAATERWWKLNQDDETPTDIIPTIVNISLSIELFLKSLIILTKEKPQNTHKFWELYRDLPLEIKDKVKEFYEKNLEKDPKESSFYSSYTITATRGDKKSNDNNEEESDANPDLKELFKTHKNAFINWRYLHELPDSGYERKFNIRAMVAAGKAMRKVAKDIALKKAMKQGRPGLFWTKADETKQEHPKDDFGPLPFIKDEEE